MSRPSRPPRYEDDDDDCSSSSSSSSSNADMRHFSEKGREKTLEPTITADQLTAHNQPDTVGSCTYLVEISVH